jgi:hypothetical protein
VCTHTEHSGFIHTPPNTDLSRIEVSVYPGRGCGPGVIVATAGPVDAREEREFYMTFFFLEQVLNRVEELVKVVGAVTD